VLGALLDVVAGLEGIIQHSSGDKIAAYLALEVY
jgi:hypothetical protein